MIFYLTIIDIEVHKFLFLKRAMKTFASNLPRQAFLGKRGQEQNPNVTILQAPVVQKVDSAIHRINYYPLDIAIGFAITYPVDSDLSGG